MSEDYRAEARFNEDFTGFSNTIETHGVQDHPVDRLEPLEPEHDYDAGYRDAARRFLYVINSALTWIIEADNSRSAAWQTAFAIGSGVCAGQSMNAVAEQLGVTRAAMSKGCKQFARSLDLPPSPYMKSEAATNNYRRSRLASIEINNAEQN